MGWENDIVGTLINDDDFIINAKYVFVNGFR